MKQPFHLKTRKIVKSVIKFDKLPISYDNCTRKTWIRSTYSSFRSNFTIYLLYHLSNIGILPRIFSFWWKKGVWRSSKLHIVTAIITYGIYWSNREKGEQKQIPFQNLIYVWAISFMKLHSKTTLSQEVSSMYLL